MRARLTALAALTALSALGSCAKSPPGATEDQAKAPAAAATPAQAALLATLPEAYRSADLDNGQAKFALCKACHTYRKDEGSAVGPNLYGVFGRRAGAFAGYSYSSGMKALGVTWDADHLNTWISRPSAMVPGTKMTYIGMESAADRRDLIAYLKIVTSPAS